MLKMHNKRLCLDRNVEETDEPPWLATAVRFDSLPGEGCFDCFPRLGDLLRGTPGHVGGRVSHESVATGDRTEKVGDPLVVRASGGFARFQAHSANWIDKCGHHVLLSQHLRPASKHNRDMRAGYRDATRCWGQRQKSIAAEPETLSAFQGSSTGGRRGANRRTQKTPPGARWALWRRSPSGGTQSERGG